MKKMKRVKWIEVYRERRRRTTKLEWEDFRWAKKDTYGTEFIETDFTIAIFIRIDNCLSNESDPLHYLGAENLLYQQSAAIENLSNWIRPSFSALEIILLKMKERISVDKVTGNQRKWEFFNFLCFNQI